MCKLDTVGIACSISGVTGASWCRWCKSSGTTAEGENEFPMTVTGKIQKFKMRRMMIEEIGDRS